MKLKILITAIAVIVLSFLTYQLFFSYTNPKKYVQALLKQADIKINGDRPWDIKIHNENFYARVLSQGSLGLGESYMDGWWDVKALDQFFYKLLKAEIPNKVSYDLNTLLTIITSKILNLQSKDRAFTIAYQHYDLDNTLFATMLDSFMIYSCGYWCNAQNLDEAQKQKLELISKKLKLDPGMQVLDIGCGWGGLARYMAENYGVSVTGITVSKEQANYAQEKCINLPITIKIQDYRDEQGSYDRIVSVGMFEHVGYKNYKEYMRVAHRCLKDNGIFLLHTIGRDTSVTSFDPWIEKYIFPNSMLPSLAQITQAAEGLFVIEDVHNFGADYDTTLMAWFDNFNKNWHKLTATKDERFYRMWKYYLLSCAGLFGARQAQLWQIILSKKGVLGGYKSVR